MKESSNFPKIESREEKLERLERYKRTKQLRNLGRKYRKITFESQRHRCYWCKQKIRYVYWTVDHKIPLSKGGTNDPKNKVGCCTWCNGLKGDLMPNEFIHRLKLSTSTY